MPAKKIGDGVNRERFDILYYTNNGGRGRRLLSSTPNTLRGDGRSPATEMEPWVVGRRRWVPLRTHILQREREREGGGVGVPEKRAHQLQEGCFTEKQKRQHCRIELYLCLLHESYNKNGPQPWNTQLAAVRNNTATPSCYHSGRGREGEGGSWPLCVRLETDREEISG